MNSLNSFKNLKFRRAEKRDEFSKLMIKKSDISKAVSALSWVIEDYLDLCLTQFKPGQTQGSIVAVTYDTDPAQVEIPGKFSMELSAEDISNICRDFSLLHQHYPNYSQLIEPEFSPQLSTEIFSVLIEKVIEGKANAKLPEWAERALFIKRSNKK